jgi:hypothetical protein
VPAPAPRPISGVVAGAGDEPRADSDEGVAAGMVDLAGARESVNGHERRWLWMEGKNADRWAPRLHPLTVGSGVEEDSLVWTFAHTEIMQHVMSDCLSHGNKIQDASQCRDGEKKTKNESV